MKVFQPRFDKNGGSDQQPNQKRKAVAGFVSDGFGKTRSTFLTNCIKNYMAWQGADIKQWPKLQQTRVKNGEWDTGQCYIKADHFDTLSQTYGGTDYSSYERYKKVGYTAGKSDVNDIVIHNPVSSQYATVISNDEKYDQRTNTSLQAGGDPPDITGVCPILEYDGSGWVLTIHINPSELQWDGLHNFLRQGLGYAKYYFR